MKYSTDNTNYNNKKRSSYWDNCKGFLIILVVFAHFLIDLRDQHNINNIIVTAIYMFHMPAFVFVSGYFSKSKNSCSLRSIMLLGGAYFLYNSCFIIFNLYQGIPNISLTFPYYSGWYLLALIIWRLFTPYLVNIRGIMFLLISFFVLSGFWSEFDLKYSVEKIIGFYPYFMAGYLLKEETAKKIQGTFRKNSVLIGLLLLCIATGAGIFAQRTFNIIMQDLLPGFYVRPGLTQAYGRIAILIIASLCIVSMLLISAEKQIPLLTKAGKNSLAIYLLHRPITLWFTGLVMYNTEQEQILKACIGTLLVVVVFGADVVSDYLKKILNICIDSLLGNGGSGPRFKYTLCRILLLVCFFDILLLPALGRLSQQKSIDPDRPGGVP